MLKKYFKYIDFVSLAIVFILFLIGIIALFSANGSVTGDLSEVWKQILWFAIGGGLVAVMIVIDYTIFEKLWIPMYLLIMLLLGLVLFTEPINRCE